MPRRVLRQKGERFASIRHRQSTYYSPDGNNVSIFEYAERDYTIERNYLPLLNWNIAGVEVFANYYNKARPTSLIIFPYTRIPKTRFSEYIIFFNSRSERPGRGGGIEKYSASGIPEHIVREEFR